MRKTNEFQDLLQGFFIDWLVVGRNVSPKTVSAYRDTFSLFVRWLNESQKISPDKIDMTDFSLERIEDFLRYLSGERNNCARTVNCRLAAIKSFCRYASYRAPESLGELRRILSISKKTERRDELTYLDAREIGWLIKACSTNTETGRETQLLMRLLYNTGARISELLELRVGDLISGDGDKLHVSLVGKGRKERTLPLWQETANEIKRAIARKELQSSDYLFKGRNVVHLTRSGARSRINGAAEAASIAHPSLKLKKVTPHVFRHSTAMAMLVAGVDISTIAIWLGHESIQTTHRYMVSDMKLKEDAIEKAHYDWGTGKQTRYRADSHILKFLNSL